MLVIKLIKKLQALVVYMKAKAVRKQLSIISNCSGRVEDTTDLCEKRIEFAIQMRERLEERAYTKLESDINRIETERKEASRLLEEINSL